MKHRRFHRLGGVLMALALLISQAAGAGSEGEIGPGSTLIRTTRELTGGLSYINTVTRHPRLGRGESYTLELAPGGGAYPITVQGDGTVYYGNTITRAIELAEERGFHVLAGINSDFYAFSTGVPLGLAVEEGCYLSDGGQEAAVVFTPEGAALVEDAGVEMLLENAASGAAVRVSRLNKPRETAGGPCLLTSRYSTVSSRTTGEGWFVKLRILEGELTTSGSMSLEVAETFLLDGACPLEEGFLYLTAAEQDPAQLEVWASFQPGDPVTLTTWCEDENLARAQWATGCGDVLVRDGAATDPAGWDRVIAGAAPRTALGVREDGTLICHVADGRRLGHSQGLSLEDLAQQMLELGCVWAVNLDGGGSSVMNVRLPAGSGCGTVSRPSDDTPRRSASYLLLVTDDPGDGVPAGLTLSNDGSVVLTGSTLELGPVLAYDSGLNPVQADLSDVVVTSASGLGSVEGGIYTAGPVPGTDTLLLFSPSAGLYGFAQVWVTDALTRLDVGPSPLELKTGEQAALAVSGSFWSRPALRGSAGALFQAEGDVGGVDETGLFTAGETGGEGAVTVSAGGLSRTVPVLVEQTYTHTDVTPEDWSYDAVEYCYNAGITSGISTTLFGRGEYITRGDFTLMLYRAAGKPAVEGEDPFSDVTREDYFSDAVLWAWQTGLASGVGDGSFGARMAITRQDAFTILGRALPRLGIEAGQADEALLDGYADLDQLADYARGPVSALTQAGVVQGGGDGLLRPIDPITREQTAAILYRTLLRPVEPPPDDSAGSQEEEPAVPPEDDPQVSPPDGPEEPRQA